TLFFDFLPVELGNVHGYKLRFHLYTVPGQVFYNASRKLVLKGVDGIVFVADSQAERIEETIESFDNLIDNLADYKRRLEDIPTVIQYNKRDLPNILSIAELEQRLNRMHLPYFEAVAIRGVNVYETLRELAKMTLRQIETSRII
ncbi:MAG: GTPase domain-containing protein, partial [Candidatus Omnitrophica bacterium]|nr:GTPase domain-containing protein [Candidatus Omnitrophota bacterium]